MQTILAGMSKLSLVAQRNIFFRNIFDKNEELLTKATAEVRLRERQISCRCLHEAKVKRVVSLVMIIEPLM
jgi:hypothetical protein